MKARRLVERALITWHDHPSLGNNVNGPSLIRVPDWVASPLGRYYLYFAHHQGTHIRLAYADALTGPWHIHAAGVLPLQQSGLYDHVASPDIHVDPVRQEIRLYLHGVAFAPGTPTDGHESAFGAASRWIGNQRTRVATSRDGLSFAARCENLGASYLRVFAWQGVTYGLAMPGVLYRSPDGLTGFERGPILFSAAFRHAAVWRRAHWLHVFFTQVGDCPESILHTRIDLRPDWTSWTPGPARVLLSPERSYEGGDLDLAPSARGPVYEPMRQLRDPAVFEDEDALYLLYALAGEQGIGLATLHHASEDD